jgi:hypothetical protein
MSSCCTSSCSPYSCAPYYGGITNVQVAVGITANIASYTTAGTLVTLTFAVTNNTPMNLNSPIIITPNNNVAQIVLVGSNIPPGGNVTRTRYYYITAADLLLNGINFTASSYVIVAGRKGMASTLGVTVPRV